MTLANARIAVQPIADAVEAMGAGLAARCEEGGRLSRSRLDAMQPEAFEYARSLADVETALAGLTFAERLQSDYEIGLAVVYAAMCVRAVGARALFSPAAYNLSADVTEALRPPLAWAESVLATDRLSAIAEELVGRSDPSGRYGLSDEHEEVRRLFARFSDERVAPLAEHIHRHDDIIPEDLIREYAELGVFGISIPEEFGGSMVDNLTMCLATEELSRGSVGAGGSVITRPEICAKALMKGGSEEQKKKWLPRIAAGQELVSVAVTEPNAGSDVAALRVTARPVEGGYVINGEKTWCTFAGRASVFSLLARTGTTESKHRGLTLFLVPKPAKISKDDHHHFRHEQEGGGSVEGHAIPTMGYRGMHSFATSFDNYFVPAENRIGEEGQGFKLQMAGFAGGRIQTAARAVGLMESALRAAIAYANDRNVFGRPLATFSMTQAKLVQMAATVMVSRQLSYRVAEMMDEGQGQMEASLVKLKSCRDAEWLTREALQLHGGMGYSEEYAVSRYFADARVLSIFEGAEEVLALSVVARQKLSAIIGA